MGSGKKNYKNRPKKFTLGKFKSDDEHKKVSKEDFDNLIALWKKGKEKNDK